MAPAVQFSHRLLGTPRFLPEASLSLCARPSQISAFLARPRPTTMTAFRPPHGDALYPQLSRSWTTCIQPVLRMANHTELPGPRPDS